QRLREARQALVTAIGFGLPVVGLHWAGPSLSGSAPGAHFWPRFLQAVLIVMLFVSPAGGPMLAAGLRAIIFRSRNADLLVALGLVTTVAGSLTGMFVPSLRELNFFHQTAVILAVVNVGRYLEVRARGRAWPALAAHFFSVAPASRRCEPLEPTPRL